VCAAGVCDTVLILLGAFGAAAALESAPDLRLVLLGAGAVFLLVLGIKSLRATSVRLDTDSPAAVLPPRSVLLRTVSVSLLNPHAVLDTVGVIGAAVASQPASSRGTFALGTVSASWLWFAFLAVCAAALRRHLTPRRARYFDRFSALVLLLFAGFLTTELIAALR
jgi:L-lysine exporter family protein LysE/ArgO